MAAASTSSATAKAIVAAVSGQKIDDLRRALARHRGAVPAQAMMNAGRLAWTPGLTLLVKHGGDLNASFKNYRALHALIQEKPHVGGSSTPKRVACLTWMLEHGADPQLAAAWPAARAVIIAAFAGDRGYVHAIRASDTRLDIFTAAALGDATRVQKCLAADPALATARDGGFLTALQCCGGSKMGATNAKTALGLLACARLLVDAGADVNAWTPSWGHEVSVSYFVIRSGQVDMLTLLLGRGLNATEAVAAAAWDHRADILDLLIAHGADLNRAYDHTRPVLNELVRWGRFAPARTYLAKGASPNLPDDRGWTAMHQVVSRGNLKMLKDLLAAGGDPNCADLDGKTPRGMAKHAGRADLLKAIDEARPRRGTTLAP